MNSFARIVLLAVFSAAAAPAMAQEGPPRLSLAQAAQVMNEIFEPQLREVEADIATGVVKALAPGACYTLTDGISLQQYSGSGLGIGGALELFVVVQRKDGVAHYDDGRTIDARHFDSVAALQADNPGKTVFTDTVTAGCFEDAHTARGERNRLNRAITKDYRADIRAKIDVLTIR